MKNTSRRNFIEKSLQVATAGTALTVMTPGNSEAAVPKALPVFSHHVFFWLKNPNSESDKQELLSGLKSGESFLMV